ncbi:MAG TPA: glucosaminidase domain-containing protein [Bacteroidia bacterium]|nr:glucosaminidase domain-containing protein [Bacteroidia bacterium]
MKTACCNTRQIRFVENRAVCANPRCTNYLGQTMAFRDYTKIKHITAVSLFVFSVLFTFDDFSHGKQENIMLTGHGRNKTASPPTLQNLQNEMMLQNIICIPEVIAQVRIESGNMNSFLFKRTNNLLGMRYPFKRTTQACGIYLPANDTIILGTQQELKKYAKQEHYAVYTSWQKSIEDYKHWQESRFKVKEKYLEFLGHVYAEDSLYIDKLRAISME